MEKRLDDIKQEELHPTYQALAQTIGLNATMKLGQAYGGACLYLPQLYALTASRRLARDKKIIEDYKSGKYTKQQLGRKYKMTAIGIGDVIKRTQSLSQGAIHHDDSIIEQIRQELRGLDEKGRHQVLRYTIKRKNSSRS